MGPSSRETGMCNGTRVRVAIQHSQPPYVAAASKTGARLIETLGGTVSRMPCLRRKHFPLRGTPNSQVREITSWPFCRGRLCSWRGPQAKLV